MHRPHVFSTTPSLVLLVAAAGLTASAQGCTDDVSTIQSTHSAIEVADATPPDAGDLICTPEACYELLYSDPEARDEMDEENLADASTTVDAATPYDAPSAPLDGAAPAPAGDAAVADAPLFYTDAGVGHSLPDTWDYNIWASNCHTAANQFVLQCAPSHTCGVVACGGDPTTSIAHHTINWELRPDGQTCLYGWGQGCCWAGTSNPPVLTGATAQSCVRALCLGQDGPDTRPLPAGQTVEIPGFSACVREAAGRPVNSISVSGANFSDSNRTSCLSCCDRRADAWPVTWGADRKVEFLRNCQTLCNGFFGNNTAAVPHFHDSLAVRAGRACVAGTSTWSFSSRYEQCRGCCLDKAQVGEYPRANFSSCMAVCNSEYR